MCAFTVTRDPRFRSASNPGDCQDRVKVRIQGHYDGMCPQREGKDFLISGPRHPEFADMYALTSEAAQESRGISRKTLIQHQAHGRVSSQAALLSAALSSRLAAAKASPAERRPAQVQDNSGKGLRGSGTVRRPPLLDAPSVSCRGCRVAVHLVRVPRDAIKVPHHSHSDTSRPILIHPGVWVVRVLRPERELNARLEQR